MTAPSPAARSAPLDLVDGRGLSDQGKVFAHYFTPYPRSIDNRVPSRDYYSRNYLTINGEGGKHRSYGGLLRDRPTGRRPLGKNWQVRDMRTEIRQAQAAGIDGFTLNILGFNGRTWDNSRYLMRAADREGFAIIPMLDASSVHASAARAAKGIARLLAHPSAHTIGQDHVVSSFLAESRTVSWWRTLIGDLGRRYKIPVKFIAVFNNPSTKNMRAFARFSYGLGAWGYRNAAGAKASPDYAAQAHALGAKWMHTVAVQDARPRSGTYAEAGNTDTLRATWARAIEDGADFVQIATWNDYSESTSIAPSVAHGDTFLELMSFYAAWFTNGSRPPITEDHVVVTHRTQFWAARTLSGIENMSPTLGGSTVRPRDRVEALVFLTAPASIIVTSGTSTRTVRRPAGISKVVVPLGPGRPSAQIVRDGSAVKTLVSPYAVVRTPLVQDLQYVAASS